jgi:hypothetical protein
MFCYLYSKFIKEFKIKVIAEVKTAAKTERIKAKRLSYKIEKKQINFTQN